MSEALEFTGERFTPECVREIWYEHMHRYAFASSLVSGLSVLDAACGEGYGSSLLALTAHSVSGVDIDEKTIEHAGQRYGRDNLEFHAADCLNLPFDDDSFDCVVSFETVEHLSDQERLISEFARVLKPGGFALISSPDKAIYTEALGNQNEFHVRELYRDEFQDLIRTQFVACKILQQQLMFHSVIWSDEEGRATFHRDDGESVQEDNRPSGRGTYLLAICASTDESLPDLESSVWMFDDVASSVYRHYLHEIRKNMAAGEILSDMKRKIEVLESALEADRPSLPWWRRWFGRNA